MGDRISVQFKDVGGDNSVVIFSHWGGQEFLKFSKDFIEDMRSNNSLWQRSSGEVAAVFIAQCWKEGHEVYVEKDVFSGDNSDNGNYLYNIEKDTWKKHNPKYKGE